MSLWGGDARRSGGGDRTGSGKKEAANADFPDERRRDKKRVSRHSRKFFNHQDHLIISLSHAAVTETILKEE